MGNEEGIAFWRGTRFYGELEMSRRMYSWNLLWTLEPQSSLPWIVSCDFNELISNSEKLGGLIGLKVRWIWI